MLNAHPHISKICLWQILDRRCYFQCQILNCNLSRDVMDLQKVSEWFAVGHECFEIVNMRSKMTWILRPLSIITISESDTLSRCYHGSFEAR